MQKARGEGLHHALDGDIHRLLARVQHQVGLRWRLIGRVDAGETGDLTRARNKLKQQAIERTTPTGTPPGRYRPTDAVIAFLDRL